MSQEQAIRSLTLPGYGNKKGQIWDHTVAFQLHINSLITNDHLVAVCHRPNPCQQGFMSRYASLPGVPNYRNRCLIPHSRPTNQNDRLEGNVKCRKY